MNYLPDASHEPIIDDMIKPRCQRSPIILITLDEVTSKRTQAIKLLNLPIHLLLAFITISHRASDNRIKAKKSKNTIHRLRCMLLIEGSRDKSSSDARRLKTCAWTRFFNDLKEAELHWLFLINAIGTAIYCDCFLHGGGVRGGHGNMVSP